MDIDEYVWRTKSKLYDLAKDIQCTKETLSNYKRQQTTPSLIMAMKINCLTANEITMYELLLDHEKLEYNEWKITYEERLREKYEKIKKKMEIKRVKEYK